MASTGKSQYLKPDAALTSSAAADAFGGGEGNAELLIAANQARWSEHLEAANLNAPDDEATEALDVEAAQDAAGVEFMLDSRGKPAVAVRGNFVVGVYEGVDGRAGKVVLHYDRENGDLEVAETEETPELAALKAQIAAASEVEKAKREAERIIEDARQRAAKISAEAQQDAVDAKAKAAADADADSSAADPDAGTTGGPESSIDISKATKPELEAEAERRGITVTGTGRDGLVKADDLRKALRADEQ